MAGASGGGWVRPTFVNVNGGPLEKVELAKVSYAWVTLMVTNDTLVQQTMCCLLAPCLLVLLDGSEGG